MANWNEIGAKVSHAATQTVRKTEEIAETATMQLKLSMLTSKRDKQFEKLGKLTYKQLKTGESHAEEIAAVISQIDTLGAQIAKQKGKIERAKAEKAAEKAAAKEKKEQEKQAAEQADSPESCVKEVQEIIDSNKDTSNN
ncbi:MAG: hypothetical protein IJZ83_02525 [Clostridia bacterium]|nr:hypothetical protein [Clostridia bacterium]